MTLEGTIEDIIFRNEDNGYTVALLSHGDELDTIVGKLIQIRVGENVRVNGSFVKNAKYGAQFSFDTAEIIEPNSVEGIEKYLSSGLVYGVGPVTAHAIVSMYGENTLSVIEYTPEKLENVKGISKKKAEAIAESVQSLKKMQNAVMFLQKYDITTNLALKIFEIYGDKTIEIVEKNPYKLVEDITGVGFLTADKIAASMGVEIDSEFRIRAGFLHVLDDMSEKNGHTFLPKLMLESNVCKLLGLEKSEHEGKFKNVLDNLIFDKVVVEEWRDGVNVVANSKLYFTELSIARKLAALSVSAKLDARNLDEEISLFEKINHIQFHVDQKNAISSSIKNGVGVITGGPGTGKTTIVKCIISILKQDRKKVLLVAPTGRAAKRLSESTGEEAKTIHRALEIDFASKTRMFKFNETNTLDFDCVIVDEVSMVDCMLANGLLKALKRDCKLILVGDKDQLPSVGAGNVLADILSSRKINVSYLTKIYRQDDASLIVSNAHLINNGEMPQIDNSSKDFFFESKVETEDVKNSIISMATDRLPSYLGVDIASIQILSPLKAGVCGVENLNRSLQEKINPPSISKAELVVGQTVFRKGDKVMQMANNYDVEWKKNNGMYVEVGMGVFNGDIGYIHSIDFQTGETCVWFEDGREVVYPRTDIFQLSLAYAITVHKSQGCEFDVVVMPVLAGASIILTRNLFYTAITRAKKAVVLVGEKKNIRRMVSNNFTQQRYTLLSSFLKEEVERLEKIYD